MKGSISTKSFKWLIFYRWNTDERWCHQRPTNSKKLIFQCYRTSCFKLDFCNQKEISKFDFQVDIYLALSKVWSKKRLLLWSYLLFVIALFTEKIRQTFYVFVYWAADFFLVFLCEKSHNRRTFGFFYLFTFLVLFITCISDIFLAHCDWNVKVDVIWI